MAGASIITTGSLAFLGRHAKLLVRASCPMRMCRRNLVHARGSGYGPVDVALTPRDLMNPPNNDSSTLGALGDGEDKYCQHRIMARGVGRSGT